MRTSIMKKKYIAPTTQSYELFWENGVALNINSNVTITDDEVLSNKKENPIWGNGNSQSQGGIWENMDK